MESPKFVEIVAQEWHTAVAVAALDRPGAEVSDAVMAWLHDLDLLLGPEYWRDKPGRVNVHAVRFSTGEECEAVALHLVLADEDGQALLAGPSGSREIVRWWVDCPLDFPPVARRVARAVVLDRLREAAGAGPSGG